MGEGDEKVDKGEEEEEEEGKKEKYEIGEV